ncbi:hypothetical protein MTO96_019961 [Rhipicephalus appendiculatus]
MMERGQVWARTTLLVDRRSSNALDNCAVVLPVLKPAGRGTVCGIGIASSEVGPTEHSDDGIGYNQAEIGIGRSLQRLHLPSSPHVRHLYLLQVFGQ